MMENKSIPITKQLIWRSWLAVKRNAGSAGIDKQSIEMFEYDLSKNLYKVWNRLASGSYFPPMVRAVEIPKRDGRKRILGIPTVGDRVAQTAIKILIEPRLEVIFDDDSYGYRPGKSAHDAISITRQRCWKYSWILEYDIKGLFDNISHQLLIKALKRHVKEDWVIMYIKRWLEAPMELQDGTIINRTKGTPQGGVVSPMLANLFLHYVIDAWSRRNLPGIPFCRYADDGLYHCINKGEAEKVRTLLNERLKQCGLEIHSDKTKIVFCKDGKRKQAMKGILTSFEFLGYEFVERPVRNKRKGITFRGFVPAIGKERLKELRKKVKHCLVVLRRTDLTLTDIAEKINPVVRGWLVYYGKFYPSRLKSLTWFIDQRLARWARLKYKSMNRSSLKAWKFIAKIRKENPTIFAHWKGYRLLMGAQ